jgi:hypothetical protein
MISNHTARETTGEILEAARLAGQTRQFRTKEPHVSQRLSERGATRKCVCKALQTAKTATFQADNNRWRLDGGVDSDGDELTLIVEVKNGVLVVTLF